MAQPAYTLEDISRQLLLATAADTDIGLPTAAQWVERRYRELSDRVHLRSLRGISEITYPAPLVDAGQSGGTGTVTTTYGSNLVTGQSTIFTNQQIGWYIRFQTNWYRIDDVQGQTLTLHSQYNETLGASPTTGFIALQRYTPLDRNVRWIAEVVHERMFHRLKERTLDWLDMRYPARLLVAAFPYCWAEGPSYHGDYPSGSSATLGPGLDRRKTIETYPPSTQQEIFKYVYWEVLPRQQLTSVITPEIDPYMLYEGAKADLYEYRVQKALSKDPPDAATAEILLKMRGEALQIWEQKLQQALVTDALQMTEDVELWSQYDACSDEDINPEWDNYVSRFGIVTVQ